MSNKEQKIIAICAARDCDPAYLSTFSSFAKEYNYKVLYFFSFSDLYTTESHDIGEKNIYQLINYDLIDGLIIMAQSIKNQEVLHSLTRAANKAKIPAISIDCPLEGCYNIEFNYDKAVECIITHLIEKHNISRINFIAGFRGNDYSEHRLSIYRKVLEEHNLPIEEERIGYGDFWQVPTNAVLDCFFASELPFPQAIVCANDTMAITTYDRLINAGYRVPEDVMVTGIDGIPEALQHTPSITTAKQDLEGGARKAYDILADLFEGKSCDKQIWIDSQIVYGGSCGCNPNSLSDTNPLMRSLYNNIEGTKWFNNRQIRMIADLTDKSSFQEVFDRMKHYTKEFDSSRFWLCIVDDFLIEEEFSDIIEDANLKRNGYSSKMDLMLYRNQGEWQGIMDFETTQLLPNLMGIFEEIDNIIFFPLHVHAQTIGYAALSFDDTDINITHCHQFFMNVSIALEVTKTHRRQETIIQNLENKYVHDPLTGLFNRRGFYQRVTEMYADCVANQELIMIISVDLNGLKPINDTYGHADGDIAISTVAKALMTSARRNDVCARFGGDEFVVAGTLSNEEEAEEYIKNVQSFLDAFNADSGKPYEVSASFGLVAAIPNDSITLDEFIGQADEKMYAEKAKHHLSRSR